MSSPNPPERIFSGIFENAVSYWNHNNLRIDPFLLDKAKDNRSGLSLIIRPSEALKEKFFGMQKGVEGIIGKQYGYSDSEFHLTVLTVISCVDGFRISPMEAEKYIQCLQPVLSAEGPIPIAFRGACASEDSIFFKVADGLSRLNELRAKLRRAISANCLPATMDKRYRLEAGHVTGVRFINRSGKIPGLVEYIRANSDKEMGSMEAGNIELVNNDWFMSESKTVVLRNF